MKKIIILLLILFSIGTYSQTNKNDSLRINKLEKQIKALQDSIQSIKQDDTSLYVLKRDIIQNRINYQKIDDKVDHSLREFINNWFIIAGTILFAGFMFFGKRHFIENYEKKIEQEVDFRVAKDVPLKVAEAISKLSEEEIEYIKSNLEEYKKHNSLKRNAKIIILNQKDTNLPKSFNRVMNKFNFGNKNELLEIDGLEDVFVEKNFKKIQKSEILIIENQVHDSKWNIKKQFSHKIFPGMSEELVKYLENENVKIKEQNKVPEQNIKNLKKLAELVCTNTALVYYGNANDGYFPNVADDVKDKVTFANAPSQLYGNILNMLKFLSETKKDKNAQQ